MTPLRIITALVTSSTPAGSLMKDLNSTIALTERQSTASSAAFKAGAAAISYLFKFSVASVFFVYAAMPGFYSCCSMTVGRPKSVVASLPFGLISPFKLATPPRPYLPRPGLLMGEFDLSDITIEPPFSPVRSSIVGFVHIR